MLRSTVMQTNTPVYSAAWSPDCQQVLLSSGKTLIIKPLTPNTKANRWKAHEGLILKVDWSPNSGYIISGGEDCRYKVWDMYGRQMYCSLLHEFPITSLSWAPAGDMFAAAGFNTLRLCDKAGWSQSLEKPATGSIYALAWSSDGTQLAAACANHQLMVAHVIDRRLEWQHLEAVQGSRKSVTVRDVSTEAKDKLEFPERVIQLSLGYRHLVVVTSTQCYIYKVTNFNTPIIIDLREGAVTMVLLADRHFLLVEKTSMSLYSYEGRLLASPKWPGLQTSNLNRCHVSLSPDTIALRDQADEKLVHLVQVGGEGGPPLSHSTGVAEVALNQAGAATDRLLALVDKNRDLYLAAATTLQRGLSVTRRIEKLGVMVQSVCWNSRLNILSGMQDTSLTVWYYPNVLFIDPRLTRRTIVIKDASEFGKSPMVVSFEGNHVGVRRSDGALVSSIISPHVSVLHDYAEERMWRDALRLCRSLGDETVWACLAAMAAHARDLDTAEEAYAAINQVDKVVFIQHIKSLPVRGAQLAEMALLGGNVADAESILLQNGLVFRAIMVNLHTHNWSRALELAVKHKTHVDTVLLHRKRYLEAFDKTETNEKFLQFKDQVDLDEEKIQEKISFEYEKEKAST
ncbi:intraflagellar transport protein 80 homolog isoform X2 [Macrosteles quadrilineatus]|nr:intraflagellar transport protein 80 homolog isoform X2 [Macrosteles quadrilineatus]